MTKKEIKELEQTILKDEELGEMQHLINDGMCWKLEGSIGRAAMDLLKSGQCMLGEKGCWDSYGNYVPSRHEVESGTMGSPDFVHERKEL